MKIRFLSILLLLYGSQFESLGQSNDKHEGFIYLQYSGDQNKPTARILFHLSTVIDHKMDSLAMYKLQVDDQTFGDIRNVIEKKNPLKVNSILLGSNCYEFRIRYGKETEIFLTQYTERITSTIHGIINVLKDTEKENFIKGILSQTIGEVMALNNMD